MRWGSRSPAGSSIGDGAAGELQRTVFFADYAGRGPSLALTIDGGGSARIGFGEHTAELRASAPFGSVSSFGVDPSGELYIVSYTLGRVFKIIGPPAAPPVPGGVRIVK
jgi:hypothetical protein